jgi:hypothetical protein
MRYLSLSGMQIPKVRRLTMKTIRLMFAAMLLALAGTGSAYANDVGFSISIGSPYHYGPPPVYYGPPPVYHHHTPRIYYHYDRPHYGHHFGGGHHYRGHGGHHFRGHGNHHFRGHGGPGRGHGRGHH